jgi:hypothetical protein
MNIKFNNLQECRQNLIRHSNTMYGKRMPKMNLLWKLKKEAETKEDLGKAGMSSWSRNRPHWQGIIITFGTIEIRMLIRGDVQTVRLLGAERQRVVIWQTQTLRSEHSVVCVQGHTDEGRYGWGGGGTVGYNARWETMCINTREETVAKCQGTASNNKTLATSIYATLVRSH